MQRLAINFLIILVLYVLSIGPMFWHWYEAYYVGGTPFVSKLYRPLLWVCEQSEFVRDWVNRYINWWILG